MPMFDFNVSAAPVVQRDYTVSVSSELRYTPDHAQRKYTPKSAERSLQGRNVYIKTTADHVDEFNAYFELAILEYNSRQKRRDRRKSLDYYHEVKIPEQEFVIQLGSRETAGVLTAEAYDRGIDKEWEAARAAGKGYDLTPWLRVGPDRDKVLGCLERIGRGLQERFPNFHFSTIAINDDEPAGTPHLHAGGFWTAEGYKQGGKAAGVQVQCSMTRALKQMGYQDISEFTGAVRQYVAEEMAMDGLRMVRGKSEGKKRLPVDQYRELRKKQADVEARERAVEARERAVAQERAELHREREKASEAILKASEAVQEANGVIAECRGWQQQRAKVASMQRRQAMIAELGRSLRSDGQSERGYEK